MDLFSPGATHAQSTPRGTDSDAGSEPEMRLGSRQSSPVVAADAGRRRPTTQVRSMVNSELKIICEVFITYLKKNGSLPVIP